MQPPTATKLGDGAFLLSVKSETADRFARFGEAKMELFDYIEGVLQPVAPALNARPDLSDRGFGKRANGRSESVSFLAAYFARITSASATGAPPRALLRSAASINARISSVSSGATGGTPVWKNLTISAISPR